MDLSTTHTLLVGTLTDWPVDWILIGAFAVLVSLDALRSGLARASALALALPPAFLALGMLAQTILASSIASQFSTPIASAALFGILLAGFYFLTHRILGSWSDISKGPLQALIAGLACAAIGVSVWLQIPALDSIWHFGPQVQAAFAQSYRLWWIIGAYAALAYARS